ncbi:MAG TPA: hypothetical protein P5513_05575 [Candidatus Diapherotrites archaeon]|nr:hypothetical protein [Candidatus Diapherotrites archaeon]
MQKDIKNGKGIIILFAIISLSFILSSNLVVADDMYDGNTQIVDENVINEAISEIETHASSQFALKIRFTQLLGTINLKIEQTQLIISKLQDNNIDTSAVEDKVSELISIKNDVLTTLENITPDYNIETLGAQYVATKQSAMYVIKEIREWNNANVSKEIREDIKKELQSQKKELKTEDKLQIRELVREHNAQIKNDYQKTYEQLKQQKRDMNEIKQNLIDIKQEQLQQQKIKMQFTKEKIKSQAEVMTKEKIQNIREIVNRNIEKNDLQKQNAKGQR